MKILAIWITKGLFIFVVCIADWNVCSNLGIKLLSPTINTDNVSNLETKIIQIGKIVIVNIKNLILKTSGVGVIIIENLPRANYRYFSTLSSDSGNQNIIFYFKFDDYSKMCVNISNIDKNINFNGQIVYISN